MAGFRMRFWQDTRGGKEEGAFIICERLHLIISTLLACTGGGDTRLILGNLSPSNSRGLIKKTDKSFTVLLTLAITIHLVIL